MPRQREFDLTEALQNLMNIFWEKGYEGTSMHDIEAATGLKKQSLYRIYGNKRKMYLAALTEYEKSEVKQAWALLHQEGTPAEKFERLFMYLISYSKETGDRRGCFLCNACVDQAPYDDETDELTQSIMGRVKTNFMQALETSEVYSTNEALKKQKVIMLMKCYFGMRVLIKANMSEEDLVGAVKQIITDI